MKNDTGLSKLIMKCKDKEFGEKRKEFILPENHYFVIMFRCNMIRGENLPNKIGRKVKDPPTRVV